ncbi:MAG: CoA transferase [Chloroflexota bacterium]|nr:CoA transferase [Chloroflexota bacterium]
MLALEGIKVLDLTEVIAGPFATMMLGDMGAEVIKIERVNGEASRRGVLPGKNGVKIGWKATPKFMAVNRSKKDLAIDITQEHGKEIILKLAKTADVMIESFRPGAMDRLGLGYEHISEVNPRIIYVSVTGYGDKGPFAHRIGGDSWIQEMAGIVSRQGCRNGPPFLCGIQIADVSTSMLTAFSIVTALFSREKTGIGQRLSSSLLNSAIHIQSYELAEYLIGGELNTKVGRGQNPFWPPPIGVYRAKDGDVGTIFGMGEHWSIIARLLGIEQLVNDPRFATDEARWEHREELYPLLDEAFGQKTRAEWQTIFREAKLRCDPCLTYAELVDHPQVEANEMIVTVDHPTEGKIRMPAVPVKFDKTPGRPQSPSPLLGHHTEEILLELGYSLSEIKQMAEAGVVKLASK